MALQRKQEVINNIHTFYNYPFFFHSTSSYRVLMNVIQLSTITRPSFNVVIYTVLAGWTMLTTERYVHTAQKRHKVDAN